MPQQSFASVSSSVANASHSPPAITRATVGSMNLRYTTSLEPFLGTYRIVWDSESALEPRTPSAPLVTDLRDGVFTLAHHERSSEWPKEPTHTSRAPPVALRLYDTFLGADRVASKLMPSVCVAPREPVRRTSASSTSSSSSSSSSSSYEYTTPSESPNSSLHLLPMTFSSPLPTPVFSPPSQPQPQQTHTWRFNWDPTFPRLGFRHEGMDLTTAWGHALSFSTLTDDSGHPFALLSLRLAGPDAGTLVVLAKRQKDRYGREGLSDAERERLGMRDVPDA